jgi:hypothetical protein
MCAFIAPKIIENYTNTKTREEPRCFCYPVRSYKGLLTTLVLAYTFKIKEREKTV